MQYTLVLTINQTNNSMITRENMRGGGPYKHASTERIFLKQIRGCSHKTAAIDGEGAGIVILVLEGNLFF